MRWMDSLVDRVVHRYRPLRDKLIIVITDGDIMAARTIEGAASRIGADVIRQTAGNPTRIDPQQVLHAIDRSPASTVLVMADDAGNSGEGRGEKLIAYLAHAGAIDAVIAVASDTRGVRGVRVDASITRTGQISRRAVNKHGQPVHGHRLLGDTVDIVNGIHVPVIGIGDLGKAPAGHGAQRVLLEAIVQARRLARESRDSQMDAQGERLALA